MIPFWNPSDLFPEWNNPLLKRTIPLLKGIAPFRERKAAFQLPTGLSAERKFPFSERNIAFLNPSAISLERDFPFQARIVPFWR